MPTTSAIPPNLAAAIRSGSDRNELVHPGAPGWCVTGISKPFPCPRRLALIVERASRLHTSSCDLLRVCGFPGTAAGYSSPAVYGPVMGLRGSLSQGKKYLRCGRNTRGRLEQAYARDCYPCACSRDNETAQPGPCLAECSYEKAGIPCDASSALPPSPSSWSRSSSRSWSSGSTVSAISSCRRRRPSQRLTLGRLPQPALVRCRPSPRATCGPTWHAFHSAATLPRLGSRPP